MKKIAVIAGGNSSEYIISLRSAENVAQAIDNNKYQVYIVRVQHRLWALQGGEHDGAEIDLNKFGFQTQAGFIAFDAAYIMIHGTPGEDGLLQGYFESMNIPYSTGNVLNMSLTFNKFFCNNYLRAQGITVADSVLLKKDSSYNSQQVVERLGLPCFVKPNDAGSSFGISKVKQADELPAAIEKAFSEGNEVVIERFINGTEVTCGVLKTASKAMVLPLTEIVSKNEFFDFEAKYTPECVEEITPARIPAALSEKVQQIASTIYDKLHCKGIVRVDFIIEGDTPYLLELNTVPGMSATSLIPQQLAAYGITQTEAFSLVLDDMFAQ